MNHADAAYELQPHASARTWKRAISRASAEQERVGETAAAGDVRLVAFPPRSAGVEGHVATEHCGAAVRLKQVFLFGYTLKNALQMLAARPQRKLMGNGFVQKFFIHGSIHAILNANLSREMLANGNFPLRAHEHQIRQVWRWQGWAHASLLKADHPFWKITLSLFLNVFIEKNVEEMAMNL